MGQNDNYIYRGYWKLYWEISFIDIQTLSVWNIIYQHHVL